jgi:formate dehydrogenase subunit beta
MTITTKIEIPNQDVLQALRELLRKMLETEGIEAVLVPCRLPMKNSVMPTLISDPRHVDRADPLAPSFPLNAAKIVSRLTRKPSGARIAAFLRPCEIRAFVELVKLHQGRADQVLLIGMDCLGAFQNSAYAEFAGDDLDASSRRFYDQCLAGDVDQVEGIDLAPACRVCESRVADGADVQIGLLGVVPGDHLIARSQSDAGRQLLQTLECPETTVPATRQQVLEAVQKHRSAQRDAMFAATREATQDLKHLSAYLAACVNCYNCRVACPVCYCRECVFVTDVFDHEPAQYVRWSERRGAIKMPTDTTFYHLTRLVHMSTACVGCGQCSNACPNDIPVMELFRTIAHRTQQAFDYQAGRDVSEKPPMSEFREEEFEDVVGMT